MRDLRARDERVKRVDLAAAVDDARGSAARVTAAAQRVQELRETIQRARTERAALPPKPALLALADRYVARRTRELEDAIGEQLRTEAAHAGQLAAVDEARGRLAIARGQRELVERHFARWREARIKLAERRED